MTALKNLQAVWPELGPMNLKTTSSRYWHCSVRPAGGNRQSVVNDMTFDELDQTIIQPWLAARAFTVEGQRIEPARGLAEIRIVQTKEPKQYFADLYGLGMDAIGIADESTDRRLLPFKDGLDLTFDLLFPAGGLTAPQPEVRQIVATCRRLPQVCRALGTRSGNGKLPYDFVDEHDAQHLIHALLSAYLTHSVRKDPIPKLAGADPHRADVAIDELGVLIAVKYVRGPEDQHRISDEYSHDLASCAQWSQLKTLIYLIFNSAALDDPAALERLSGMKNIQDKRLDFEVVLA